MTIAATAALPFMAGAEEPAEVEDLERYVGTWDISAEIRFPDASDPIEVAGTVTKEMIGGRWIVSSFEADFYGSPFKGQDVYGYDSDRGEWTAVWVDNFSDQILRHAGQADEDGELVLVGRNKDATGEWVTERRSDHWMSDDVFDTKFVMELPNGTEFPALTIHHVRAGTQTATNQPGEVR